MVFRVDIEGYQRAALGCVRILARACGLDEEFELKRYQGFTQTLAPNVPVKIIRPLFGEAGKEVRGQVPTAVEFVLTLAEGRLRNFAYLTQGAPALSLTKRTTELLRGTLTKQLQSGTPEAHTKLTAELFKLCFPDIETLDHFDPSAQSLIVAAIPTSDKIFWKLYFNTRLDVSSPHRQKILAMLGCVGIEGAALYDAIYAESSRSAFHGIGVDLTDTARAKLYTRVPKEHLAEELKRLAGFLPLAEDPALTTFMERLPAEVLTPEVEVAMACTKATAATFKITCFFDQHALTTLHTNQVAEMLEDYHGQGQLFTSCIKNLDQLRDRLQSNTNQTSKAHEHPLHAIGIELPAQNVPKLNVYLEPRPAVIQEA